MFDDDEDLDPGNPFLRPDQTIALIQRMNAGGGGPRRRRREESDAPPGGSSLPPPPPGWVEPELPPEILAEMEVIRQGGTLEGITPKGVGGAPEPSAATEERVISHASPPSVPRGLVRPAHSASPALRGVDFEGKQLFTNDGSYPLSDRELAALHLICERAIARNLREYLANLRRKPCVSATPTGPGTVGTTPGPSLTVKSLKRKRKTKSPTPAPTAVSPDTVTAPGDSPMESAT